MKNYKQILLAGLVLFALAVFLQAVFAQSSIEWIKPPSVGEAPVAASSDGEVFNESQLVLPGETPTTPTGPLLCKKVSDCVGQLGKKISSTLFD